MSIRLDARRSYHEINSGMLNSSVVWLQASGGLMIKGTPPSPIVQKAMLTPSSVFAYWMRGSITELSYTISGALA